MAWNILRPFSRSDKRASSEKSTRRVPVLEDTRKLSSDREDARRDLAEDEVSRFEARRPPSDRKELIETLLYEYRERPESLYREQKREDSLHDFLASEMVLDSLDQQVVPEEEVTGLAVGEASETWSEHPRVNKVPRTIRFGEHTLRVGSFLAQGGFGVVCDADRVKPEEIFYAGEATDDEDSEGVEARLMIPPAKTETSGFVIKFFELSEENAHLLGEMAREIASLARFSARDDADERIVGPLRLFAERQKEDSSLAGPIRKGEEIDPESREHLPGFLGATRILMPDKGGKEIELIAIALEKASGMEVRDAFMETASEELSPQLYREVIEGAAKALRPFHRHNLLHRDVKNGNIIADIKDGKIDSLKLIDTGIAIDADYERRIEMERGSRELLETVLFLREKLLLLANDGLMNEEAERALIKFSEMAAESDTWPLEDVEGFIEEFEQLVNMMIPKSWQPLLKEHLKSRGVGERMHEGTPAYMDKSALSGWPTKASDVFAIGRTIYALVLDEEIRQKKSHPNEEQRLRGLQLDPLTDYEPKLRRIIQDDALVDVIVSMLDPDSRKRPQDADAVLNALAQMDARKTAQHLASAG